MVSTSPKILMDEAYRQPLGSRVDGAILQPDLARIRFVDAREDLDQRRLAGAVLAEKRMHLAGAHLEVHRVERERAPKALGELGRLKQHRRRVCHGIVRPTGFRSHALLAKRSTLRVTEISDRRRLPRQPFTPQRSR